jgi:predicted enzyme related to lactoylglutathione lyase
LRNNQEKKMGIKYVHTNIVAKDMRKLAAFYEEVFDCYPIPPERDLSGEWLDRSINIKNANIKGIHLHLPGYEEGGPTLEIFSYNEYISNAANQINTTGFAHIAFEVDDVEKVKQKLLSAGGSLHGEVVTFSVTGKGTVTMVYTRDPEGNIVELQKWEQD